jgi:hypothetical protein
MLGEEAVGLEGRFPEKVFKGMRDMLGMSAVPAAAQAALDRFRLPSTLVPPSEAQLTLGLKAPDSDEVRIAPYHASMLHRSACPSVRLPREVALWVGGCCPSAQRVEADGSSRARGWHLFALESIRRGESVGLVGVCCSAGGLPRFFCMYWFAVGVSVMATCGNDAQVYSVDELMAMVLHYVHVIGEAYGEGTIKDAVLTVPA